MFTREDTKAMKGLAIILMCMHHLWGFPDRQPIGDYAINSPKLPFTVCGTDVFLAIGSFGKVCVAVFLFLAGYGLYKQFSAGKLDLWQKIKSFYLSFWKVFFIMIPIGFLFFSDQAQLTEKSVELYNSFTTFDLKTLIMNLLGLSFSYNAEWWFVYAYVVSLFLGYVYIMLTRKCDNLYVELFILAVINAVVYMIVPKVIDLPVFSRIKTSIFYVRYMKLPCIMAFFSGIVFSKYSSLENILARLEKARPARRLFICFVGLIILFYWRTFGSGAIYDFLTTPFFIALSIGVLRLFGRKNFLYTGFIALGKHSENMWLVHPFFCYYFSFFVRIVFASRNSIIALFVLVILSLICSIGIEWFYIGIVKLRAWLLSRLPQTNRQEA